MESPKPASHNENNFKDVEAISFVKYILSKHKRAIPKLDEVDKWPNIDGTVELQDTNNNLIGKFEAQVKTLCENHNYKYPITVAFISYCDNIALLPVLLLLVDSHAEKIYWIYMSKEFINNTDYESHKSTVTTKININDFISRDNLAYLSDWEKILNECKNVKKISDSINFVIKNEGSNDINGKIKEIFLFISSKTVRDSNIEPLQDIDAYVQDIQTDNQIEQAINVNIYNADYDLLIPNINLVVENRLYNNDGSVCIIVSNKNQAVASIYIVFTVVLKGMKVLSTRIKISPMERESAFHQLMFLKLMSSISDNSKIIALNTEDNNIFFEGTVKMLDIDHFSDAELEYLKKIVYIEKKLKINIKLPRSSQWQDVTDIDNLYEIISKGKMELPELNMSFTLEDNDFASKMLNDGIFLFTFTTNEVFEVFGNKIDLGEQIYILPKVKVIDVLKNNITIESVKGTKNLIIYKRFYGECSLEEIVAKEGIGTFNHK